MALGWTDRQKGRQAGRHADRASDKVREGVGDREDLKCTMVSGFTGEREGRGGVTKEV